MVFGIGSLWHDLLSLFLYHGLWEEHKSFVGTTNDYVFKKHEKDMQASRQDGALS